MVQLGEKHECDDCGIKVYDLGRPEAICPRCGRDLKTSGGPKRVELPASRPRPEPAVYEEAIEEPPSEAADDLDEDLGADEEFELVEDESSDEEEEEADLDDEE